jgi:glycosyltransferase involved in cell wall biosynthesis
MSGQRPELDRAQPALRVMQVLGTFGGGGAQRQACNLVEALRDQGLQSWGLSLVDRGEFAESSRHADRFRSLGLRRRTPLAIVAGALRLRRLVRELAIDVLHVHGSTGLPFIVAALSGMRRRPRIVFGWHDSGIARAGDTPNLAIRWAIRRCDALLASSQLVADWLSRVARRDEVGVLHGGVPERAPSSPTQPPRILWVGRWVADKDPTTMVRVAAALRQRGHRFSLTMVGPATGAGIGYRQHHRDLIAELGLADCTDVPDAVTPRDLDRLFAESAIGVQTSLTEGLSMALLEQMMVGLAIVATNVGDTTEALDGGRCGILVAPREESVLAARVGELLADERLRERFGKAARSQALRRYSLDAMARSATDVYEKVCLKRW